MATLGYKGQPCIFSVKIFLLPRITIYIFEILRVRRGMLCIWLLGNTESLNLERLLASSDSGAETASVARPMERVGCKICRQN